MEKAIKNPFIEKWVKHKNEQGASIDILHPEPVGFCPACGSPYNNTEPFCMICGKVLDEALTGDLLDEAMESYNRYHPSNYAPDPRVELMVQDKDIEDHSAVSFGDALIRIIDREGLKDSDVYNEAEVSRQVFFNIKNNLQRFPKRETAIRLVLALHLDEDESDWLLSLAGYSLSSGSKEDLIITYCIQRKIYDIMQINEKLYDAGLQTIVRPLAKRYVE